MSYNLQKGKTQYLQKRKIDRKSLSNLKEENTKLRDDYKKLCLIENNLIAKVNSLRNQIDQLKKNQSKHQPSNYYPNINNFNNHFNNNKEFDFFDDPFFNEERDSFNIMNNNMRIQRFPLPRINNQNRLIGLEDFGEFNPLPILQPENEDNLEEEIIQQLCPNPDTMTYEQLLELEENVGNVSKGMKKKDINKIRKVPFKKESFKDEDKCIICQYDFKEMEYVKWLICGHLFHPECIDAWLEKNKQCPTCKRDV